MISVRDCRLPDWVPGNNAAPYRLIFISFCSAYVGHGGWGILNTTATNFDCVHFFFSPFRVCRGVDEAGSADWRLQKDFCNHWCCMNGLLSSGNCESNSEVEMTSLMAARGISSWLLAPRSGLFMCFEKYNMGSYSSATDSTKPPTSTLGQRPDWSGRPPSTRLSWSTTISSTPSRLWIKNFDVSWEVTLWICVKYLASLIDWA